MGYYVRALCTEGTPPPMRPVVDFARDLGSTITLDPDFMSTDLDDPAWEQVGLRYKDGKRPIILEVNRAGGDDDLVREEIEEFLESLEDAPRGASRERVEQHLRTTSFIIAAQLFTDDIDDDGFNALGNVLRYFVARNGGMIQADGEGFYDGTEVIVPLV